MRSVAPMHQVDEVLAVAVCTEIARNQPKSPARFSETGYEQYHSEPRGWCEGEPHRPRRIITAPTGGVVSGSVHAPWCRFVAACLSRLHASYAKGIDVWLRIFDPRLTLGDHDDLKACVIRPALILLVCLPLLAIPTTTSLLEEIVARDSRMYILQHSKSAPINSYRLLSPQKGQGVSENRTGTSLSHHTAAQRSLGTTQTAF